MNTSVTAQLGSSGAQRVSLTRLESALHEASVYGIGATSDFNQGVIVEAAMAFASSRSGQKIADIEILQQKLEFAEWEWNRATEGMKERDAKIVLLESRVEGAITTFKAIYAKTPHPDIAAMAFNAIQTLSPQDNTILHEEKPHG